MCSEATGRAVEIYSSMMIASTWRCRSEMCVSLGGFIYAYALVLSGCRTATSVPSSTLVARVLSRFSIHLDKAIVKVYGPGGSCEIRPNRPPTTWGGHFKERIDGKIAYSFRPIDKAAVAAV